MAWKRIALASCAVAACGLPLTALAESNVASGAGGLTATARVNFSIVIPRLLFLQVGTGTLLANNSTIDTITFTPAVGVIGDGSVVGGAGGNLTGGAVTVRVIGNTGDVALGATGPANLTNASSNTIPWTQIATAVTGGATHPTINGSGTSYTAAGNVVNINGTWTYTYLNANVPAAGTYSGQVLYTATAP